MKIPQIYTPENSTINILLWGQEGIGKTFLAASMPKKAMYLTFDPNALNGVNDLIATGKLNRDEIPFVEYDTGDYKEVASAYRDSRNPFGLEEIYKQMPFKTLVIDSLSSFYKLALQWGVEYTALNSPKDKSTIERPGFGGYGVRSVATKEMVFNVLTWCRRHKVNSVFIAHKGEMLKDENTGTLYQGLSLSGDTPSDIAKWFDECWLMGKNEHGERSLLVQPSNGIRPLKTRMFADDVRSVVANNLDLTRLLTDWQVYGKLDQSKINNMLMKGN